MDEKRLGSDSARDERIGKMSPQKISLNSILKNASISENNNPSILKQSMNTDNSKVENSPTKSMQNRSEEESSFRKKQKAHRNAVSIGSQYNNFEILRKGAMTKSLIVKTTPILWDEEKEKKFWKVKRGEISSTESRIRKKQRDQVAMIPFLQENLKSDNEYIQREILFKRYQEGEELSADDYKLLENTSTLISNCMDRKSVQGAINSIPKDVVEEVRGN